MTFRRLRILTGAAAVAACLPPAAGAANLRDITPADIAAWKRIDEAVLTPQGNWFAYRENKSASVGDTAVVILSTRNNTRNRYPATAAESGLTDLQFAPSERWAAFRGPDGLQIVELSSGIARRASSARAFRWLPDASDRLLVESDVVPASKTFDVTIMDAGTGRGDTLRQLSEYVLDAAGSQLAWVDVQGIHVRNLVSGAVRTVAQPGTVDSYRGLTWSRSGKALAALRTTQTGDRALLVLRGLSGGARKTSLFDPKSWSGFPEDVSLCPQAAYRGFFPRLNESPFLWRDDEQGLFFRVCGSPPKAPPDLGLPTAVAVWHWKDPQLPEARKMQARRGVRPAFLAFVSFDDGRFVQLSDGKMSEVAPHVRGRYALGFDSQSYGWTNNTLMSHRGTQLRDYALIDIRTGRRTEVVKGLRVPMVLNGFAEPMLAIPQLTPDGAYVLYQQDGDYMSYEVATGVRRNLTAGLPTRFYLKSNDPKSHFQLKQPPQIFPALQGWAEGFRSVLLSDNYDVWLLPLNGGAARNLTVNGRRNNITYGRTFVGGGIDQQTLPSDKPVDLRQPMYFKALDLSAWRSGLGVLRPQERQLRMYGWNDADVDYYLNASGNVRIFSRTTALEPMDFYLADASWKQARRLTDISPEAREIRWIPQPRYLSYTSSHGEPLNAVLYMPIGYEPGKKYPMLVGIYERLSGVLHYYRDPANRFDDTAQWLREGYALLCPDIVPRVGEPGPAAAEAVQAAVDAAVATGTVDRERLGLFGHSYGGYETSFTVSQLQLFKAAVTYAGMSNLWSDFGAVYATGTPKSQIYEHAQATLGGPWWEKWDAYLNNSPLYHARNIRTPLLIVHGDQDMFVPFSQAEELFNTLRRMGNKQAVMLQYTGEEHDFSPELYSDLHLRMREFFDHFLRDRPAPRWWSDGVSYYEGEASGSAVRPKS